MYYTPESFFFFSKFNFMERLELKSPMGSSPALIVVNQRTRLEMAGWQGAFSTKDSGLATTFFL